MVYHNASTTHKIKRRACDVCDQNSVRDNAIIKVVVTVGVEKRDGINKMMKV